MEDKTQVTCKDCKHFNEYMKKTEDKPCKFRDFPDYYNICFCFRRKDFIIKTRHITS